MNGAPRAEARPGRVPLTAAVIAQDCAETIGRCVESLSFAEDVLVVDGGSRDDTVEAAQSRGARVVVNPWPGFAAQRRVALGHARHDWVLVCDSDEEVTPALAREIENVLAAPAARGSNEPAGYRVRRRSQFLQGWIDVGPWTRDRKLRLVRRDAVRVTEASVHEGYAVDGPVGDLVQPLLHYTHPTLSESVRRMNRYTSLEAGDRAGRRRVRAGDVLLLPAGVFINYYLLRGCWRAGVRGFLLAATTAMYRSVLYIKISIAQRAEDTAGGAAANRAYV